MFRFFATLLVTGVAVLAASAWWSGRDAREPAPARPAEADPRPAPAAMPAIVEPPPAPAPVRAAARPDPTPAPPIPAAPAVTRPERVAREPERELAPIPKPRVAPPPEPTVAAAAPRRTPPPIPAPPIVDLAEAAAAAIPEPATPEPIPAPFAPEPPREEAVGETRIPEPAPFSDEIVAWGEPDAGESYGHENVIWVEGDGDVAGLFVDAPGEPALAEPDEAVAMSDHDASADRIRRLLDVYESLGRRR